MPPTVEDLERVRSRLAENKEEQKHLDKVIEEMHDKGWADLTPGERAFVQQKVDKCEKCGCRLDDCTCEDKNKLPDYVEKDTE